MSEEALILTESHLSIPQFIRELPSEERVATKTAERWCRIGLLDREGNRVKLPCIHRGGRRTSMEAYYRWLERLQG